MMDCGTYCAFFLRQMFGAEPVECIEAIPVMLPEGSDQRCDQAMNAKWRFPNGGIGSALADLSAPLTSRLPWCEATHKEKVIQDETLGEESAKEHVVVKKVVGCLMMMPVVCRFCGINPFPIRDSFTIFSRDNVLISSKNPCRVIANSPVIQGIGLTLSNNTPSAPSRTRKF